MNNIEQPMKVENAETLLEFLEEGQERGFIDLEEPEILDDFTYKQMQYKKYGYAVQN